MDLKVPILLLGKYAKNLNIFYNIYLQYKSLVGIGIDFLTVFLKFVVTFD